MTKLRTSPNPRVIAAIPCHNEVEFIAGIVGTARRYVDQVIVVDDGSSDGTATAAEAAGAVVVRHDSNMGPGAAYGSCFKAARSAGADILVTLDGDRQHDPDELPQIIAPLMDGEADVTIGSRFLGDYKIRRYRKFGIDVITWLYNVGSAVKIVDAQSCYRGYSGKALDSLRVTERGFGFSVELLVQAREKGLAVKEVPVSCIYHPASHSTNPVIHGVGVALVVVKHRFKSLWRRLAGASQAGPVAR